MKNIRLTAILLVTLLVQTSCSQNKTQQLELGLAYIHKYHAGCQLADKSIHRFDGGGVFAKWSIQPIYNFRFILDAQIGSQESINNTGMYKSFGAILHYGFGGIKKARTLTFFTETGIRLDALDGVYHNFPLYVGARIKLGNEMDLITRANLPYLQRVNFLQSFFTSYGFEISLSYTFKTNVKNTKMRFGTRNHKLSMPCPSL